MCLRLFQLVNVVKLSKYLRNKISDMKKTKAKIEPICNLINQYGTVTITELESHGYEKREVAQRVMRINQLGGNIEVIKPENGWRNGCVTYRLRGKIDIDELIARERSRIMLQEERIDCTDEIEPGVYETPTGRIYAYSGLKPPTCDGYSFNNRTVIGSSLSPNIEMVI